MAVARMLCRLADDKRWVEPTVRTLTTCLIQLPELVAALRYGHPYDPQRYREMAGALILIGEHLEGLKKLTFELNDRLLQSLLSPLINDLPFDSADNTDLRKLQLHYTYLKIRSLSIKALHALAYNFFSLISERQRADLLRTLIKFTLRAHSINVPQAKLKNMTLDLLEQQQHLVNMQRYEISQRQRIWDLWIPFSPLNNIPFVIPFSWKKVPSIQVRGTRLDCLANASVPEEPNTVELQIGGIFTKDCIPAELAAFYYETIVSKEGRDFQEIEIGMARVKEFSDEQGTTKVKRVIDFVTYRGSGFKCYVTKKQQQEATTEGILLSYLISVVFLFIFIS